MHQGSKCFINHAMPLQTRFTRECSSGNPDREMPAACMCVTDMLGTVIHHFQRLWLQLPLQLFANALRTVIIHGGRFPDAVHGSTLRNGLTLTVA
jgi:hypothetical protein